MSNKVFGRECSPALAETVKRVTDKLIELESAETDKYSLCVFECSCGFHIGIDSSYLLQVADVRIDCPSCHAVIAVEGKS